MRILQVQIIFILNSSDFKYLYYLYSMKEHSVQKALVKKDKDVVLKERKGERTFSSEKDMKDMKNMKRKNSYSQGIFLSDGPQLKLDQFMKIPPQILNLHLPVSRVRVINFDKHFYKFLVFSRNGRQARYEHIRVQKIINSVYTPDHKKTDLVYLACSWYMKQNKLIPYQFIEDINENRKLPDITKMASVLQKVDPENKFGITLRPFKFGSKKIIEFSSKQKYIFLPQCQVQTNTKIAVQLEKNPQTEMSSNEQYKVIKHLDYRLEKQIFDAYYEKEEALQRRQIEQISRERQIRRQIDEKRSRERTSLKYTSIKQCSPYFNSLTQRQRRRSLLFPSQTQRCQEGKMIKGMQVNIIAQFRRDFDQLLESFPVDIGNLSHLKEAKQILAQKIHECFQKKPIVLDRKNGQNEFIITGPPLDLERMNHVLANLARDYCLKSIRLQPYRTSLRGGGLKQIQSYLLKIQQNYEFILDEMSSQIQTSIKNQRSLQEYQDFQEQFKNNFSRKTKEYQNKNRDVRSIKQSIQLVIVMDVTGSMSSCLQTAKKECTQLISSCRSINPNQIKVKMGCVFYRDYGDSPMIQRIDLTEDTLKINTSINKIICSGGDDLAEATIQGLEAAAGLSWTSGTETKKYVYLICDAPPHGQRFGNTKSTDKYLEKNKNVTVGQTFKHKKLNISVIAVGNLYQTIPEFKKIFGEQFMQNEGSSPSAVIKSVEDKIKSEINRFIQIGKELERMFASKKQDIDNAVMKKMVESMNVQLSKEKAEKLIRKGMKQAQKCLDAIKNLDDSD